MGHGARYKRRIDRLDADHTARDRSRGGMLWLYRGGGRRPECGVAVQRVRRRRGSDPDRHLEGFAWIGRREGYLPALREAQYFPWILQDVDLHLPSLRESGGG